MEVIYGGCFSAFIITVLSIVILVFFCLLEQHRIRRVFIVAPRKMEEFDKSSLRGLLELWGSGQFRGHSLTLESDTEVWSSRENPLYRECCITDGTSRGTLV